MDSLPDYETIGSFYLGKKYDLAGRRLLDEKVLYDAKDLTTHAMCVGMTGSGKTGLCLSMLEEAAIDGIPAICLDPKGDLGNLLLAFPQLAPSDFEKWLDAAEASRTGMDLKQYAQATASKWRAGLEAWDQNAARVARYRDSVDMAIYTPGSNAGIAMTVLKNFAAPAQKVIDDAEVMRERVSGAASGLLTLIGIAADPLTSREHILLANIFDSAWRAGRSLDLPELIRSIQSPPFDKIGVFDLETFYPSSERLKLSMTLNNLLASPSFAGWLEGVPLDIRKLLYNDQGKPRLSIISIAHLNDSERMFFVTILLNELLGWVRSQTGTSSLRAIFYMDEVHGFFPPVANPPSKPPMLVLLKQARAFGLGIVLATQNPVDLDYKGLSNIGTWFLGRLQTQRDKQRVLEGLEGAAVQTGTQFDRGRMEQTLAALGNRVFLMNNVHDDAPTIFQTRWAMSFLRGPLSRDQIQTLMAGRRPAAVATTAATAPVAAAVSSSASPAQAMTEGQRPIVHHAIEERFWLPSPAPQLGHKLLYRPGLLATVACHYVRASADLDAWVDKTLVYNLAADELDGSLPNDVWQTAEELPHGQLPLSSQPEDDFGFCDVPADMLNPKQYSRWGKEIADHIYRRLPARLYQCAELKKTSRLGQDELDARLSWGQELRELRDAEREKLRNKYASKLAGLQSKIRTARQRLDRQQAQYDQEKWNTALNVGQSVLGWLVGSKARSTRNAAGRSLGRATQQRSDARQATEELDDLLREKRALENECEMEISGSADRLRPESLTLKAIEVPCRKGDIAVKLLALLWIPCQVDASGGDQPIEPLTGL